MANAMKRISSRVEMDNIVAWLMFERICVRFLSFSVMLSFDSVSFIPNFSHLSYW